MGYLEKLQNVKVGDTVFVKGMDTIPLSHKIIAIDGDTATIDSEGNDGTPWKFSIKTSNAITPPTAYWISTEERNNP